MTEKILSKDLCGLSKKEIKLLTECKDKEEAIEQFRILGYKVDSADLDAIKLAYERRNETSDASILDLEQLEQVAGGFEMRAKSTIGKEYLNNIKHIFPAACEVGTLDENTVNDFVESAKKECAQRNLEEEPLGRMMTTTIEKVVRGDMQENYENCGGSVKEVEGFNFHDNKSLYSDIKAVAIKIYNDHGNEKVTLEEIVRTAMYIVSFTGDIQLNVESPETSFSVNVHYRDAETTAETRYDGSRNLLNPKVLLEMLNENIRELNENKREGEYEINELPNDYLLDNDYINYLSDLFVYVDEKGDVEFNQVAFDNILKMLEKGKLYSIIEVTTALCENASWKELKEFREKNLGDSDINYLLRQYNTSPLLSYEEVPSNDQNEDQNEDENEDENENIVDVAEDVVESICLELEEEEEEEEINIVSMSKEVQRDLNLYHDSEDSAIDDTSSSSGESSDEEGTQSLPLPHPTVLTDKEITDLCAEAISSAEKVQEYGKIKAKMIKDFRSKMSEAVEICKKTEVSNDDKMQLAFKIKIEEAYGAKKESGFKCVMHDMQWEIERQLKVKNINSLEEYKLKEEIKKALCNEGKEILNIFWESTLASLKEILKAGKEDCVVPFLENATQGFYACTFGGPLGYDLGNLITEWEENKKITEDEAFELRIKAVQNYANSGKEALEFYSSKLKTLIDKLELKKGYLKFLEQLEKSIGNICTSQEINHVNKVIDYEKKLVRGKLVRGESKGTEGQLIIEAMVNAAKCQYDLQSALETKKKSIGLTKSSDYLERLEKALENKHKEIKNAFKKHFENISKMMREDKLIDEKEAYKLKIAAIEYMFDKESELFDDQNKKISEMRSSKQINAIDEYNLKNFAWEKKFESQTDLLRLLLKVKTEHNVPESEIEGNIERHIQELYRSERQWFGEKIKNAKQQEKDKDKREYVILATFTLYNNRIRIRRIFYDFEAAKQTEIEVKKSAIGSFYDFMMKEADDEFSTYEEEANRMLGDETEKALLLRHAMETRLARKKIAEDVAYKEREKLAETEDEKALAKATMLKNKLEIIPDEYWCQIEDAPKNLNSIKSIAEEMLKCSADLMREMDEEKIKAIPKENYSKRNEIISKMFNNRIFWVKQNFLEKIMRLSEELKEENQELSEKLRSFGLEQYDKELQKVAEESLEKRIEAINNYFDGKEETSSDPVKPVKYERFKLGFEATTMYCKDKVFVTFLYYDSLIKYEVNKEVLEGEIEKIKNQPQELQEKLKNFISEYRYFLGEKQLSREKILEARKLITKEMALGMKDIFSKSYIELKKSSIDSKEEWLEELRQSALHHLALGSAQFCLFDVLKNTNLSEEILKGKLNEAAENTARLIVNHITNVSIAFLSEEGGYDKDKKLLQLIEELINTLEQNENILEDFELDDGEKEIAKGYLESLKTMKEKCIVRPAPKKTEIVSSFVSSAVYFAGSIAIGGLLFLPAMPLVILLTCVSATSACLGFFAAYIIRAIRATVNRNKIGEYNQQALLYRHTLLRQYSEDDSLNWWYNIDKYEYNQCINP